MGMQIHSVRIIVAALAFVATSGFADSIFEDGFELCRTADAVKWDGGGNGTSWSDPLNWEGDTLPAHGDEVVIRIPASNTIEYGDFLTTTLSCLSATSTLHVINGSLELDGPAIIRANLAISNGSVTANAPMVVTGAFDLGPGNLQGTGTVTVNGPFTWVSGSQHGTGETIAEGGLLISGASTKNLSERTLSLNAASNWTGSGEVTLRWGATINVNAPFAAANPGHNPEHQHQ
jgi:hypothetical protein